MKVTLIYFIPRSFIKYIKMCLTNKSLVWFSTRKYVFSEVGAITISFATDLTAIWSFSSMNPLVYFQAVSS